MELVASFTICNLKELRASREKVMPFLTGRKPSGWT
jgi:hypothetical protein